MAVVINPLHSRSASGKFGERVLFQKQRGRQIARRRFTRPKQPADDSRGMRQRAEIRAVELLWDLLQKQDIRFLSDPRSILEMAQIVGDLRGITQLGGFNDILRHGTFFEPAVWVAGSDYGTREHGEGITYDLAMSRPPWSLRGMIMKGYQIPSRDNSIPQDYVPPGVFFAWLISAFEANRLLRFQSPGLVFLRSHLPIFEAV